MAPFVVRRSRYARRAPKRQPLVLTALAAFGLAIGHVAAAQISSPLYSTELDSKVNLAVLSLQGFWLREFPRLAPTLPYTQMQKIYSYDTTRVVDPTGRCQVGGLNAFYCPAGDAIFYEGPHFMQPMLTRSGDFAVAVVMAHEWGHAIQRRLAPTRAPRKLHIDDELEADCFAGAWSKYVDEEDTSSRLEDGDLDEAVIGLFGARDPTWLHWMDPRAHGTALQRIEAFLLGYRNGSKRCLGQMPPEFHRR